MVSITTEYISVGANRHPSAADWDRESGLLAFGADENVALWQPADPHQRGIYGLLQGHTDKVNAVKFYKSARWKSLLLLTGSVDRTIRIWEAKPTAAVDSTPGPLFSHVKTVQSHENSINCIDISAGESTDIFASGGADGTVRIWRIIEGEDRRVQNASLVETIHLKPRFFPLALALRVLPGDPDGGYPEGQSVLIAVAGTTSTIQIYVGQYLASDDPQQSEPFKLVATLTGHEGWIRSLAFTNTGQAQSSPSDILLASASQDKYIRLWRVTSGFIQPSGKPTAKVDDQILAGGGQQTLTNKAHMFVIGRAKYSITFEALLFGHEDWVYTVTWSPDPNRAQLLSASADSSLVVWEADPVSGVWFSAARMGELSAVKGATTATGSAGGFWVGLWTSSTGNEVVSLGRTGSWRSWSYDADMDTWIQTLGVSGHVKSVNDICWEPSGGYLLSTSSDQTTRLHARWQKHDGGNLSSSWHEFSRPQIHGYDLNSISALGPSQFVSGADEKLLRVFDETKAIAHLLAKLSGFNSSSEEGMAEAADIPVLGLSNKAVDDVNSDDLDTVDPGMNGMRGAAAAEASSSSAHPISLDLNHPPIEDHLARHTLWPEHQKLYGHGYEISAVTAAYDGTLIATACKASSIDHAVIRLYDTTTWNEIPRPLTAHTLTITALRFSYDDEYLLSVGRDRQWAVFKRDSTDKALFRLLTSNPKGHSRMILSASWAPLHRSSASAADAAVFATAGRDKQVKIWALDDEGNQSFQCKVTIALVQPVTAIDFLPAVVDKSLYLAVGDDAGNISIHVITAEKWVVTSSFSFPRLDCPSGGITQLAWRPSEPIRAAQQVDAGALAKIDKKGAFELAVASEDSSVRIYSVNNLPP